jgi:hypothetical protein
MSKILRNPTKSEISNFFDNVSTAILMFEEGNYSYFEELKEQHSKAGNPLRWGDIGRGIGLMFRVIDSYKRLRVDLKNLLNDEQRQICEEVVKIPADIYAFEILKLKFDKNQANLNA